MAIVEWAWLSAMCMEADLVRLMPRGWMIALDVMRVLAWRLVVLTPLPVSVLVLASLSALPLVWAVVG